MSALFLLAFLPQFVDVSRGHVGRQTLSAARALPEPLSHSPD